MDDESKKATDAMKGPSEIAAKILGVDKEKLFDSVNGPIAQAAKMLRENSMLNTGALGKLQEMIKADKEAMSHINFDPISPYFEPVKDHNSAESFRERLVSWINDFDKELDSEHEVGVRLVNFGQTVTFHLEKIGHWNPSLISFSGFNDSGEPVELIQHVSQISILLMKVKRRDITKPRIGFAAWQDDEQAESKPDE